MNLLELEESIRKDSIDPSSDDYTEKKGDYTQWITRGNGVYYPEQKIQLLKKVPSGLYGINYDENSSTYFLYKQQYDTDAIIELPIPEIKTVLDDVQSFWDNEEKYKKYNMIHKRGIILYGVPGGGKSATLTLIINKIIKNYDGIVFNIKTERDVNYFNSFMQFSFRLIEPDRKIIVALEDIDGLVKSSPDVETNLLNILDGIGQMRGVLYLATTNYPEELNDRIINRPSRFDRRIEIGLPDDNVRKYFISHVLKKEDLENINIDEWVKKTEGLTISHIKELIISVIIQGNDFDYTIKLLDDFTNTRPSSKDFKGKKKIGFGG